MYRQGIDRTDPATVASPASTQCPEPSCRRRAEIEDRWTLTSTHGPVEMVKVRCEAGCWYTVEAVRLHGLTSLR
jgi:hypothetical protein